MTHGDIETMDKGGQWVNRVEGDPERSASFSSREEAVEEGRRQAAETGTVHTVRDATPTGDITDEAI